MKITILGSGTSGGVPRIGNHWGDCDPDEPKNRRRRVSILVEHEGTALIVDTSPDLREQCLKARITRLDAVLYTHDHADHTHGIDDLRGISNIMGKRLDIYANRQTLDVLEQRFAYVFKSLKGYPAIADAHEITGPFRVGNIDIIPFRQIHGDMETLGFRFGSMAYSTDLNVLPEESIDVLQGVDTWIVDALRYAPHPTHPHLDLTLSWIARVKPRRAVLTHMTWDMDYATLRRNLPQGVEPGYDGMLLS